VSAFTLSVATLVAVDNQLIQVPLLNLYPEPTTSLFRYLLSSSLLLLSLELSDTAIYEP